MQQHKEQQGFLTFAQNTADVDYLELAYLQALNIKATQKNNSYAVIVDSNTIKLLTDKHRSVFDYVIELYTDYNIPASRRKFANECQAFWLTPFKETVKLESDLLFTRSIDHWWTAFRLKNMCLSTGCKNYLGIKSTVRKYRELFDANCLPDVYNGLMYFRFSQEAKTFFETALHIQTNWDHVRTRLKNCVEEQPSTDVLYALAALMVGEETVTMPSMNFLNFVHMKPAINGLAEDTKFTDVFVTEQDSNMIRINNINQLHPVHYYEKDFVTAEMREWYESRIS
jgi:sulfur relay (sulfurtransferase) DsrC/TusE family protein